MIFLITFEDIESLAMILGGGHGAMIREKFLEVLDACLRVPEEKLPNLIGMINITFYTFGT